MFRVGTHTSIAGGPELAFQRSADVGGNTLQIFAKSPRGRSFPVFSAEQLELGRTERMRTDQQGGLIHSNYLINLSKPREKIGQEIESILHDFQLADALGYDAINVHIGKMNGFSLDEAMGNMQKNLIYLFGILEKKGLMSVQFLRENTAGQGSEIGSTLEEIGHFYRTYMSDLPVKFCFDTAHCRGGGIDLRRRDLILEQIEEQIGIDQLYSIHLNDAKVPLGAHLDRHASLGRGFIGRPTLAPIISRAATHDRSLYIETPEPDLRPDEISKVRQIANGDLGWIDAFHTAHASEQRLKKYEGTVQQGLF